MGFKINFTIDYIQEDFTCFGTIASTCNTD